MNWFSQIFPIFLLVVWVAKLWIRIKWLEHQIDDVERRLAWTEDIVVRDVVFHGKPI